MLNSVQVSGSIPSWNAVGHWWHATAVFVKCGSVRLHILGCQGLAHLGGVVCPTAVAVRVPRPLEACRPCVLVCSAVWLLLSSLLRRHCAGLRARPDKLRTPRPQHCKHVVIVSCWSTPSLWASVSRVVDPGCTCWGIFGLPDCQAFLGRICVQRPWLAEASRGCIQGAAAAQPWHSDRLPACCPDVSWWWNLGDACHLSGVTVPAAAVSTSCVRPCRCFPGLLCGGVAVCARGTGPEHSQGIIHALMFLGLGGG